MPSSVNFDMQISTCLCLWRRFVSAANKSNLHAPNKPLQAVASIQIYCFLESRRAECMGSVGGAPSWCEILHGKLHIFVLFGVFWPLFFSCGGGRSYSRSSRPIFYWWRSLQPRSTPLVLQVDLYGFLHRV